MINKEKNFVSAVIYVHNSASRIERFLSTIIDVLERNFEHSEIICVNDYSDDNSVAIIDSVSKKAKTTSISVINISYFHGLELAMNAGVDMAIGDFVFEFDNTSLDFNPDVIMEIYHHSLEGVDIVSASPNKKEKISSRLFYKVYDKCSTVGQRMQTESFRILSRRVINRVSSINKTVPYRKAVYMNCGLKTDVIKYDVIECATDKVDTAEKNYRSSLAVDTLILFTNVGYQFSKTMSVIMIIITLLATIYTIIAFLFSNPVEGWTSTILFLSIAFFGVFVIFTIIIKYLQIIVGLIFKRKTYSFESIEKLTK